MHLLETRDDNTLRLARFAGDKIPQYAILSHTWESDDEEVTFQDVIIGAGSSKAGHRKLQFCGEQARKDGLRYFWIDSCCINKSSSSELSEAINSMFKWYRNAAKCYVYLADVTGEGGDQQAFCQSRWFTRGWTLQELLAPRDLEFFSQDGVSLGDKRSREDEIHKTTGIPVEALRDLEGSLGRFGVEERFSWAAKRKTTIEEDQAYCLLGIFDTYLPLIYGEGKEHAFRRLQREISTQHPRDPHRPTEVSADEKAVPCLANLAAMDQSRFISQILDRSKHACAWILENQKYISWFEKDESSLLWMTAKAGCGKTTMAAHISRMISSRQTPNAPLPRIDGPDCVVLFFFFQNSTHEAERSALTALRTLVGQLAQQESRVLPILLRRHEFLSAKGDFEWSWDSASGVLGEMLEQAGLNSCIYIILDAVDECLAESRSLILDWARGIVDGHTASPTPRPILKVLVTSRPGGDIVDQLSDSPTLAIEDTDTERDVQALIRSRVDELAHRRRLSSEVTQTIAQFLATNARGMFLWIVLITKELEGRDERLTDEVIASKLSRIPLTLVDTYKAILDKPSPTRSEDMWRMIRWILFGFRNLTPAELNKGLCLETGVSNWYDFEGDLKFLCGSLVRVGGPQEEVSFVHQTARSFLEAFVQDSSTANTGGIAMEFHAANERLAAICVQYILSADILQELDERVFAIDSGSAYMNTVGDYFSGYPFLRYAIQSWAFHLRAIDVPSSETATLAKTLLRSRTNRSSIMQLTYFLTKPWGWWRVPIGRIPLHLAAYFNIPWLVQMLISENPSLVHATSNQNDTPLIWASEMGGIECVRMLLDAGVDPNKVEADGWSALHWAARNGHVGVARLLLTHGARLHHRDAKGHVPLDWALDRGHLEVANLFGEWIVKNHPGDPADHSDLQDLFGRVVNRRGSSKTGRLRDGRP